MAIVQSLELRREQYESRLRSITRVASNKRIQNRMNPELILAVKEWSDIAEEIAAKSYDADRMETLAQYCEPSEQGQAKKNYYLKTANELRMQAEALQKLLPAAEAKMG